MTLCLSDLSTVTTAELATELSDARQVATQAEPLYPTQFCKQQTLSSKAFYQRQGRQRRGSGRTQRLQQQLSSIYGTFE
jgi:hypothetical protein